MYNQRGSPIVMYSSVCIHSPFVSSLVIIYDYFYLNGRTSAGLRLRKRTDKLSSNRGSVRNNFYNFIQSSAALYCICSKEIPRCRVVSRSVSWFTIACEITVAKRAPRVRGGMEGILLAFSFFLHLLSFSTRKLSARAHRGCLSWFTE